MANYLKLTINKYVSCYTNNSMGIGLVVGQQTLDL